MVPSGQVVGQERPRIEGHTPGAGAVETKDTEHKLLLRGLLPARDILFRALNRSVRHTGS
ncbi:hypothetical protein AOZ06_37435 [Kibdelosporangium phytohabitans]|uniref:Uncharacterized protein n=1 Tax=Kibdelosporangium phytohabitans TaxID=860235 RepID=A0A0N9I0R2_9PSEU|nr:hypothetical protein AOZ06_37435 [Kibdelosporangium phytohabitans]